MDVVFDLDDTLVRYGKQISVPRQTHHCLRDLSARGLKLGIVSYNPLSECVAARMGLLKYADTVRFGSGYRSELVAMVVDPARPFVYFDDRRDNLEEVARAFPLARCVHVANPLYLYRDIRDAIEKTKVVTI
jgi:hypothetical protein